MQYLAKDADPLIRSTNRQTVSVNSYTLVEQLTTCLGCHR
jgi:hypothetical protein